MSEQKAQKPLDVLNDNKLVLWGTKRDDGTTPFIRVKRIENNPAIELNTGKKTQKGAPIKLETPMNPRVFRAFMKLLIKIGSGKTVGSYELRNDGFPFEYNRDQGRSVRSQERKTISIFSIGRRENGEVFFAIAAPGKPTDEIVFREDDFHIFMQNNQPVDVHLSSGLAAAAWAETVMDAYFNLFSGDWSEPEWQRRKRLENASKYGNGGGGYNGGGQRQNNNYQQNNNGGGGYQQQQRQQPQQQQQSSDGFDDDIPF